MKKFLSTVVFLLMTFFMLSSSFANVTRQQYKTAINIAGRQRMLSQKIAKCAFFLVGIKKTKKVNAELDTAMIMFNNALNNLLSGNSKLEIPAPPSAALKLKFEQIKKIWLKQYKPDVVKAKVADKVDPKLIAEIDRLSLQLLTESDAAVKLYVAQAAKNGVAGAGAQLDIAGRQRMLTQKITKEMLLFTIGVDAEKNKAATFASAKLFANSLQQLKLGDAALGLPKATGDAQLSQIYAIQKEWDKYHSFLDKTLGSGLVSKRIAGRINALSNKLLTESNRLVLLFEKH